ncbi:hypothetical protein EDD68_10639 [Melghiribacillus thermohalophilus]|uniref:IDEAL domain-containing protein n=1 Tax=Melghiribacillus thermohalophilus TaxID=1324956 RepID=A0A4R3N9H7_9BACI|nr:hypothetical protein [Melghiribacillus thermohalophilus]TCT23629.1 hypothetical protein EDD68_10639 [Melghiribacillus thermohalophilus]
MKKQKTYYQLVRYDHKGNGPFKARKEIPFEIKLAARLFLDELTFNWNKSYLEDKINHAIDEENLDDFKKYGEYYAPYTWE